MENKIPIDQKLNSIAEIVLRFNHIAVTCFILYEGIAHYTEILSVTYKHSKHPLFNILQMSSLVVIMSFALIVFTIGVAELYNKVSSKELPAKIQAILDYFKKSKLKKTEIATVCIAILVYTGCFIQNMIWDKMPCYLETSWANAPYPDSYMSVMKDDLQKFADEVKEATNGKIKIEIRNAESQNPAESFKELNTGENIQMLVTVQYYWPGDGDNFRAGDFFAAVPFGKEFEEMDDWMKTGGGQELWDEYCRSLNVRPFAFGNTGKQYGGWFKGKLNMKGDTLCVDNNPIYMRIPHLQGEVITSLHGRVTKSLFGRDIKTAMTNMDSLNAAEWMCPWEDLVLGLQNARKYIYYYKEGWQEQSTINGLYINNDYYNRLDEKTKEILKQIISSYNLRLTAKIALRNDWALAKIQEIRKNKLIVKDSLPVDVKDSLFNRWIVIIKAHRKSPLFNKIFDSYLKHRISWKQKPGEIYKVNPRYDFSIPFE